VNNRFEDILGDLPSLELAVLHLNKPECEEEDHDAFGWDQMVIGLPAALMRCTRLRHVEFCVSLTSPEEAAYYCVHANELPETIGQLQHLQHLIIHTGLPVAVSDVLSQLTQLTNLSITSRFLDDSWLADRQLFKHPTGLPPALRQLELDSLPLEALSCLTALEHLRLGVHLTCMQPSPSTMLTPLRHLTSLSLGCSQISEDGILPTDPDAEELPVNFMDLLVYSTLSSLRELHLDTLSRQGLGSEWASWPLSQIQHLQLRAGGYGQEDRAAVEAAMPQLDITIAPRLQHCHPACRLAGTQVN
jgi:hypothetical protein